MIWGLKARQERGCLSTPTRVAAPPGLPGQPSEAGASTWCLSFGGGSWEEAEDTAVQAVAGRGMPSEKAVPAEASTSAPA